MTLDETIGWCESEAKRLHQLASYVVGDPGDPYPERAERDRVAQRRTYTEVADKYAAVVQRLRNYEAVKKSEHLVSRVLCLLVEAMVRDDLNRCWKLSDEALEYINDPHVREIIKAHMPSSPRKAPQHDDPEA